MEAGHRLIQQKNRPDAVFCGSDVNGFGVIDAIRAEMSLRLGVDIGVAGYDAPSIEDFHGYSMMALSQSTAQLAEDAAELLLQLIETPNGTFRKIVRPMKLVVRASTQAVCSNIRENE